MVRLSDFQGVYEGKLVQNNICWQLTLRISIHPLNDGTLSREYQDMISGELYRVAGNDTSKVPFSFRCEWVNFKGDGKTLNFDCLAPFSVAEATEHYLFSNQDFLQVSGVIQKNIGTICLNKQYSPNFYKFEVAKTSHSIFRKLTLEYAIETTFQDSIVTNAFPSMVEAFGNIGLAVTSQEVPFLFKDYCEMPWSAEEINDLLEMIYPDVKKREIWPAWKCYALVLSEYKDIPDAVGITFDNRDPGNQGFAIFGSHPKLHNAHPHVSENSQYAWIHEIGHMLGLSHSNTPESWMNEHLPDKDRASPLVFTPYDISVLRHNHTTHAIPGHRIAIAMLLGEKTNRRRPMLELSIKSYKTYYVAEPVEVEVRLRNLSKHRGTICPGLEPEAKFLRVQIRHADRDRWLDYKPFVQYDYSGNLLTLEPEGHPDGKDRFSQLITLSFGFNGLPLFKSGRYVIRACYQYQHTRVWSEEHTLEVLKHPDDRLPVLDRKERAYLRAYLYRNMRQQHPEKFGQSIVKRYMKEHPSARVRARYAFAFARSIGDPRRIFNMQGKTLEVHCEMGNNRLATEFLKATKTYYENNINDIDIAKLENLAYRRHVTWYAHFLRSGHREDAAYAALQELKLNLLSRQVNPAALMDLPA